MSRGESLQCNGDKADGYDDAFSATQVWRAFRNATAPNSSTWQEDPSSVSQQHCSMARLLHSASASRCLRSQTAPCVQVARLQVQHMDDAQRHSLDEETAQTSAVVASTHVSGDESGIANSADRPRAGRGSCQCSCPPGRGFGYCFEMPEMPENATLNDATCDIVDTTAPLLCPGVGVPKQCHNPPLESDLDCTAVGEHMHGDVGNPKVWGGILNCTVRSNCTAANGDTRFGAATCDCKAWRFGKYGCAW
jgi:hypothetical protein